MDRTVANNSKIDISTLTGKRYTIEQMRPILAPHLDLSSNMVPEDVGLEIKKLLDGKQTNILPLKGGDAAKLSVINHATRGLSINVMHVQARLLLRDSYLGHQFSPHDKENLQRYGDMGRSVQLIDPLSGNPFKGLIGIDPESKKMTIINVDKFQIPDKILGVPIDEAAKERLRDGYSIRINNLKKDEQSFSAFVRLAASKKGFKYERIKAPKLEQTPKTQQNLTPQPGERPASPSPLVDKLTFYQKGIQQTTQTYPNGVEVLIIPQTNTDKYVLSITLPQLAQSIEMGKLFALPIMASKADTESLLQLSQQIDKAIGKNQSLQPILQQSPASVQRLLNLDLIQSITNKVDNKSGEIGPKPEISKKTSVTPQATPLQAARQSENISKPAPAKSNLKEKVVKVKPEKPVKSTPAAKSKKGPRP